MCRFKPARDGIQKLIRTLAKMHSQASMTPTGRVMGGKRGGMAEFREVQAPLPLQF